MCVHCSGKLGGSVYRDPGIAMAWLMEATTADLPTGRLGISALISLAGLALSVWSIA